MAMSLLVKTASTQPSGNIAMNMNLNLIHTGVRTSYDAVVGADTAALNAAVAAIYAGLPGLFAQRFDVGHAGLQAIEIAFRAAPSLSMGPSARAEDAIRQQLTLLSYSCTATGEDIDAALRMLTRALLEVSCADVALTLHGVDGGDGTDSAQAPAPVAASLSCDAAVSVDGEGNAVLVLSSAHLRVADDPGLTDTLNAVLAPRLLHYLNHAVLGNIMLPALSLSLPGLALVPPVFQEERTPAGDRVMVGYTGAAPVLPPQPAGQDWPAGQVFVGLDAAAINAAINAALDAVPELAGGGHADPFSYGYDLTLAGSVLIHPGAGNRVSMLLNVGGHAAVTIDLPVIPAYGARGRFSGTVSATAEIVVLPDGHIGLRIDPSAPGIGINIGFDIDLPWPFDAFRDRIAAALIDAAAGAIIPCLEYRTFDICTLPSIGLQFSGQPCMTLQLRGAQIVQLSGPAGVDLVTVQATPGLVSAPAPASGDR
jgi:hypothetical protein